MLHSLLLFDALLLNDPLSFGKRGHLRAHGAISTGVLVHFAEPHEDPSRKPAERGEFRFPAKSLAAGHFSMHTVSSYLRGRGNFEMTLASQIRQNGMHRKMSCRLRFCRKTKYSQLRGLTGRICVRFSRLNENTGRNVSTSVQMPSSPK